MCVIRCVALFAILGLCAADDLPSCSSLPGAASILSGDGVKCKVCGNYCGPSWCAAGDFAEGPPCKPHWDTVASSDPTDACCQAHDKCCGTAKQWSVLGHDSCNAKLLACVTNAEKTTTDSDPCGGDTFNDELDILGSMDDQCCGGSKGTTYNDGVDTTTCGDTTSAPTPTPQCNQKTTTTCSFYCNIGWWHPEGCEDGVCTCSDGYCADGADCVATTSYTSSKLQVSSEERPARGAAAVGALVGGLVGLVAAVAAVGIYKQRKAKQVEDPLDYELTLGDAETLYSSL